MNEKEKSAELLEYFNGLSLKEVLGLARKSFILLDENTKFETYKIALEQIREYLKTQIKMRNKGYHFDYTNACKNLLPIQRIVDEVLNDEIHN